jgi:hypothetical protein
MIKYIISFSVKCPFLILLLIYCLSFERGWAEEPTFHFVQNYRAVEGVLNIGKPILVDLNNDRRQDFISMYSNFDFVVWLNKGDGNFLPPKYGSVNNNGFPEKYNFLLSGDFNKDSYPDLAAVSNYFIYILVQKLDEFGKPTGTFTYTEKYHREYILDANLDDLNGDGRSDIVLLMSDRVEVMLRKVDGTFTPSIPVHNGQVARDFLSADFTGDGKQDLALAIDGSGILYAGNGDGSFQNRSSFPLIEPASSFRFSDSADFNKDGRPDFAATGSNVLRVYLNLGGGEFGPSQDYIFSAPPYLAPNEQFGLSITTSRDVNADGYPDLVIDLPIKSGTSVARRSMSIWLNRGDGTFQIGAERPVRLGGFRLQDLNRDDIEDLVETGPQSSGWFSNERFTPMTVSLGVGDGTFLPAIDYGRYSLPFMRPMDDYRRNLPAYAPFLLDLNGDGDPDIVRATDVGLGVFINQGDGTIITPSPINFTNPADTTGIREAIFPDINGDSRPDAAVVFNSNAVGIFLNTGAKTLTFTGIAASPDDQDQRSLFPSDLNGDGKGDLLLLSHKKLFARVFLSNGDGTFLRKDDLSVGLLPSDVAFGEFNGDGKLDVAVSLESTDALKVFFGNGDGSFGAPLEVPTVIGSGTVVEAGDFNGDLLGDLVTVSVGLKKVLILLGRGDGSFKEPVESPFKNKTDQSPTSMLEVGDLNEDGRSDLVIRHSLYGGITVMISSGDGSFPTDSSIYDPSSWDYYYRVQTFRLVDVNRDQRLDILASSHGVDHYMEGFLVLIGKGDGTFSISSVYSPGFLADFEVADWNIDGRPDLLFPYTASEYRVVFNQTPGPAPRLKGDVDRNGTVDVRDAVGVLRIIVGLSLYDPETLRAADVNCTGNSTVQDVILILQSIVTGTAIPECSEGQK